MTQKNPQLPWTDEQWDRVQQVITEEARKARVAASFLPIVGPLPPDTDYVSDDTLTYDPKRKSVGVDDTKTRRLCTLEAKVYLRGPQAADPELASALQMFRRTANILARVEDLLIFRGQDNGKLNGDASSLDAIWTLTANKASDDRLFPLDQNQTISLTSDDGAGLVSVVSEAIGKLEAAGYFGSFACVLDQELFKLAQQSESNSLVLPQERILPFLGGGPLLRCSALDEKPNQQGQKRGVVVALGGAPVDLVLARDMTLSFLQVDLDARFIFRVYEKLVLRVKQKKAIEGLKYPK